MCIFVQAGMVVYRYRKEDTVKMLADNDEDRYDSDPEYAEGVDDAMDELDEDG